MNYVTFQINEEQGGGFLDVSQEGFKVGDVIPYISTPDIEATLAKVEELGGKILQPETEIPGIGWFAFSLIPPEIGLAYLKGEGNKH